MVSRKMKQSESQSQNLSTRMVKRKLEDESTTTEEKTEDDVTHTAIIPSPPNVEVRTTFIVENASLRKGVVRKRWKILDSEEDADFLKQKKDVNDYRPGFVYQRICGCIKLLEDKQLQESRDRRQQGASENGFGLHRRRKK